MGKRHECRYWKTYRTARHCSFCRRWQYRVSGEWRDEMSLTVFAEKWLPAISSVDPVKMMTVEVAFPFEWNSYESWDSVFRVRFDFTDVMGRRAAGLGTRVDVMNGWRSAWHEHIVQIDAEAEQYYQERTGRPYSIGDNAHEQMRRIIQS